jgi:tetraacyldisaccharide 4'-kinase
MLFKPPSFWDKSGHPLAIAFEPFSWLYRLGMAVHQRAKTPCRSCIPVISVGNIVLGGAGKTPVTLALAKILQAKGYTPHVISRGYGGSVNKPVQIDPFLHNYQEVGDEPLLLAKVAPTWVSKNRRAAADLAIQAGADILLLDDAHQNQDLIKDICFLVVSASQGFGNGRVFPSGPLRQSLPSGLKKATAIIFIGEEEDALPQQLIDISYPLIRAKIVPVNPDPCPVIGFAGLGYPEKFHQTLINSGYEVLGFIPFADHCPYTLEDLQQLKKKAQEMQALLITTEKDYARIPETGREGILSLPVRLAFQEDDKLEKVLQSIFKPAGTPLL